MYLAKLSISNFRRLNSVTLEFGPGLNVLVGPNNVGKTAVVDALRALLAGVDDPYPRFDQDDLHRSKSATASGEITFEYVFRDLGPDDEADFSHALKLGVDGKIEAILGVGYGDLDKTGRLRSRKWCGDHQDVSMTSSMLDNLRSVYLPPLRDAAQGLKPSRTSQLSRLLQLLSDDAGICAADSISKLLKNFSEQYIRLVKFLLWLTDVSVVVAFQPRIRSVERQIYVCKIDDVFPAAKDCF